MCEAVPILPVRTGWEHPGPQGWGGWSRAGSSQPLGHRAGHAEAALLCLCSRGAEEHILPFPTGTRGTRVCVCVCVCTCVVHKGYYLMSIVALSTHYGAGVLYILHSMPQLGAKQRCGWDRDTVEGGSAARDLWTWRGAVWLPHAEMSLAAERCHPSHATHEATLLSALSPSLDHAGGRGWHQAMDMQQVGDVPGIFPSPLGFWQLFSCCCFLQARGSWAVGLKVTRVTPLSWAPLTPPSPPALHPLLIPTRPGAMAPSVFVINRDW